MYSLRVPRTPPVAPKDCDRSPLTESSHLNIPTCVDEVSRLPVSTGFRGPGISLTQTDGAWSAPTTISALVNRGFGAFCGVSCTDTNDCTAVGEADAPDAGPIVPVYATDEGGTWSTPAAHSGAPDGAGELTDVSCVDEADCVRRPRWQQRAHFHQLPCRGRTDRLFGCSHCCIGCAPTRPDFERRAKADTWKLLAWRRHLGRRPANRAGAIERSRPGGS
jgi:hypothetical protein